MKDEIIELPLGMVIEIIDLSCDDKWKFQGKFYAKRSFGYVAVNTVGEFGWTILATNEECIAWLRGEIA